MPIMKPYNLNSLKISQNLSELMNICLLETHLIKPLITMIMTFSIAYICVYCPEMNRKIILILRFVFCQRIL